MKNRLPRLKQSLVRVWVAGNPCGSGFVAGRAGLVVTCFHVVQAVQPNPANPQQFQVTVAGPIEVEIAGGQRFPATPHASCIGAALGSAIAADYMLLSVPTLPAPALPVGGFASADEGDEIYLGGFPLAIQQPVLARGLLSTKWRAPAHLIAAPERDVAWLDVTMNKGNSGGPVLRMADDHNEDAVIGIASFGLNPFASHMEQVIQIASQFPGGAAIMGVPMGPFFTTVGQALVSNSLGVSGCVAIDYVKGCIPLP